MSERLNCKAYLHPRYWPVWLGFGCWWLLVQLPLGVQTLLANGIGDLLFLVRPARVRVAERNLQLCFPDLPQPERRNLLRTNMRQTSMAFFETGISWWWPTEKIERLIDVEGLEHFDRLAGGALILGVHFTCLEIAGVALSARYPLDMTYRPHDNPLYDAFQRRGRTSNGRQRGDGKPPSRLLDRADLRAQVRALRSGRILWGAYDQDPGRRRGIFVPFFGIPACTLTAPSTLARLGEVPAVPLLFFRRPNGRYCVRVMPPLEDFPSGDEQRDARAYNQLAEGLIRAHPDAYLWVHRRFKTRPQGEPDIYAGLS